MSEFSKISNDLMNKIKLYHVLFEFNKNDFAILFVTNEDKVYGMGYNQQGELGLGHNYEVRGVHEVIALRDKMIVQIFSNCGTLEKSYYALGDDHTLYSWGHNNHGRLGRATDDDYDF